MVTPRLRWDWQTLCITIFTVTLWNSNVITTRCHWLSLWSYESEPCWLSSKLSTTLLWDHASMRRPLLLDQLSSGEYSILMVLRQLYHYQLVAIVMKEEWLAHCNTLMFIKLHWVATPKCHGQSYTLDRLLSVKTRLDWLTMASTGTRLLYSVAIRAALFNTK